MAYIHVYSTRINWENEPSIVSPINATNLNKMDYALKAMDDTFGNWDISKANESDLLLALKDVSYDTDTGVFVFTWFNGTTSTIDLNIEKIPVSFSMDANGVITMTTEDGTTYTADVGALIKTYTFNDSSVIDFTVTTDASGNKTVTADIVSGSIDGTKLTPNYLADCTAAKTGAETAEGHAEDSAEDAEAWAIGERGGVPVPSTDPAYENSSKWWAQHTSSSLAGLTDTDINNPSDGEVLKYNGTTSKWENGQAAAGGGSTIVVTTSESALYGQNVTITDGVTTLTQTFDNTGLATFSGVTMTGNLTIACLTASTSLNVPYFGNYTAVVSSFSASITVTYPGGTCTCVGNGESYTASSSPYTFTVHGAATYTITVTIDGVSKTDTVVITTDGQTASTSIEFGTINVTYDNDFRGISITCTQGATTITKTAPSAGNAMSFFPPTTGNWTISGTVSSDTFYSSPNPVVVSSLSTSVSATLETIPDGSTKTPTDDVSIWLSCAGIRDKAYTTLSQVLADSETFNALLGDSNACAYMARSTTWTTDLCADQYAMSMIGQYDVCCDALLGNATWASAIVASAYADYVLDDRGLVPTLSSGTGSNGVVNECGETYRSYDATYGQASWCAFDGNLNHYAAIQTGGTTAYLGYTFNDATKVGVIYYDVSTLGTLSVTYKITAQYSDDDNTWADASSEVTLSGTTNKAYIISTETSAHRYWRIKRVTSQAQSTVVGELQFYGDIGSREYIHGTNNESAYYLDGATQTPIVDPSTLSAGTYTFGSTVAKDPSDLTADYTKTIRITPNTKEIVLRPDNALYWWGYESATMEDVTTANGWSRSGYTLYAPTHNNTSLHLSSSSLTMSSFATKKSQQFNAGNKLCLISKGVTPISNVYGRAGLISDKTCSTWWSGGKIEQTSNNLLTQTLTYDSTYSGYVIIASDAGSIMDVYALWYE